VKGNTPFQAKGNTPFQAKGNTPFQVKGNTPFQVLSSPFYNWKNGGEELFLPLLLLNTKYSTLRFINGKTEGKNSFSPS